jgi:hypothetical protein
VDAMLLSAVLLWALNITVTKYMFEHGWLPLAYATIRYFAAIASSGYTRGGASARSGSRAPTGSTSASRRP